MLRSGLIVIGSVLGIVVVSIAQAQVTVDVSKITCDQFLQHKVSNPKYLAIWLSGFYSGKRNNSVVDIQSVEANADKVSRHCILNRNEALMQAVETTLGTSK